MDTPAVQALATDSTCLIFCVSDKSLQAMMVYLLWSSLHPTESMDNAAVQALLDEITCITQCMTHKQLMAATVQLLSEGGGVGGWNPYYNMSLAGAMPPDDGTVPKYVVYDTDTGFLWYNHATLAAPVWQSV